MIASIQQNRGENRCLSKKSENASTKRKYSDTFQAFILQRDTARLSEKIENLSTIRPNHTFLEQSDESRVRRVAGLKVLADTELEMSQNV